MSWNSTDEWTRNVTRAESQSIQYVNTDSLVDYQKTVVKLAGSVVGSFGGLGLGVFGVKLWHSFEEASSPKFIGQLRKIKELDALQQDALRGIFNNVD